MTRGSSRARRTPHRWLAVVGMLCALALSATIAHARTALEWVMVANAAYDAGDYAQSSAAFGEAIAAGAENPTTFYNAACSAALADQTDLAFERLEGALAGGWRNVSLTESDTDLAALRDDPRWEELLAAVRRAEEEFQRSLALPGIRTELLEMRRVDQAARRGEAIPELEGRDVRDVDAVNTARMKEIVAEHGWPTVRLVGEDGSRAAWLLVQHADADPAFQRSCLERMRATEPGQVSPVDVAYLTDRVLVNEGEPQIYGTQFWSPDGELVPRPIRDPSKVEALRAEVGMTSMQEYHRMMTGRDWEPDPAE